MNTTGIVRRIDDLGRIVIPKAIRISLGIEAGTPMELLLENGAVIFRKYQPDNCVMCHNCGEDIDIPDGAGYQYCPFCGQRLSL